MTEDSTSSVNPRRNRVLLYELDLNLSDRVACRRQYRTLRIAMYAPQSHTGTERPACQGWYGMDRDEAKAFLWAFYGELSLLTYLGSK